LANTSGVKFTERIIINCTQEFAFDYTQDYTNRLKWDSFLKKAELLDGAIIADVGVQAYCVAKNGLGMITEYISFNRPKAAAVNMIGGPYLFRTFLASWTFKPIAQNQTEVIFLYSISLRFPFNLVIGFIRRNLQQNVRSRLIDLKKSIEEHKLYTAQ
jgi:ribosome-associated toxin RatA of RatAB toxin-antitoxin module